MIAGYDATVERLQLQAWYDLKGPQETLAEWGGTTLPRFPGTPNTCRRKSGVTLAWVGPKHWLLRADIAHEAALEAALRPAAAPSEISIVQVSDTLAVFRITGADAPDVLAIGCPLDLHPDVFADAAASWTEFFGQKALVMRCMDGFDVAVEQSFGPMIADYLARALA